VSKKGVKMILVRWRRVNISRPWYRLNHIYLEIKFKVRISMRSQAQLA